MGSLVSSLQGFCGRDHLTKASIVMCGPSGAGKTTILYRLKLNETIRTCPSVGFNRETLDVVDDITLLVWDVAFGAKGWPLIRHYLTDCDGVVFVVDSTDTELFMDAKWDLASLFTYTDDPLPVIVLANKQDLEGACSPSQVACHLDLPKSRYHKWDVFGCSAITGEGLKEALENLCSKIKENRSQKRP
ncbi:ADP-ribosylation factor-like protein 11 [Hyperolius riggenbachi]|uniref:ADP-ribosylation factor-like protein 11 n=1 Tax=Hyperolius riggenbachi TaxID=752182 RepID=UPI0035A343B3